MKIFGLNKLPVPDNTENLMIKFSVVFGTGNSDFFCCVHRFEKVSAAPNWAKLPSEKVQSSDGMLIWYQLLKSTSIQNRNKYNTILCMLTLVKKYAK